MKVTLQKKGDIWPLRTFKKLITLEIVPEGPLLQLVNSQDSKNVPISTFEFSAINKNVKTPASATFPYQLAVMDQRGFLYNIEFEMNKLNNVARIGISGTALAYNPIRRREVVIALSNRSVQVYNIDSCSLLANLPAYHKSAPFYLSFHPKKPLMLSTSSTEAILWDTLKWTRTRTLSGESEVQTALFTPDGQHVIASFHDATLVMWDCDTFNVIWRIQISSLVPVVVNKRYEDIENVPVLKVNEARYSAFSVSPDVELLAYCGLGSSIFIWNLTEQRLLHEIIVPSIKTDHIVHSVFLKNYHLAILTNTGRLVFLDANKGVYIGQLSTKSKISYFAISPDHKTIAILLEASKHTLMYYDLSSIISERAYDVAQDFGGAPPQSNKSVQPLQPLVAQPQSQSDVQGEPVLSFLELVETRHDNWFSRPKLKIFLKRFGSYPDRYRPMIWKYLLQLPENNEAQTALLCKGVNIAWKNLRDLYPLKSEKSVKAVEKTLSVLAFWSPLFGDLEYLPKIVFPFTKVFPDLLSTTEALMTIFMNFCHGWWDYLPNPPIEVLNGIQQLVETFEPKLFAHFKAQHVSPQLYAWMPLQSFFSDNTTKSEWMCLWDHIISNSASFMYCFLAAYLSECKGALLLIKEKEEFNLFFQQSNPVNIQLALKKAYTYSKAVQTGDFLFSPKSGFIQPFQKLPIGTYPFFNKYPEFIVNYRSKMREKIQLEEDEYMRKRKIEHDAQKLKDDLYKDKKLWSMMDWTVDDVLDKWWESMKVDQESMMQRKSKIHDQISELRTKKLNDVADSRKGFVESYMQGTINHINALSRTADSSQKTFEANMREEVLDKNLDNLELDWKSRMNEMAQAKDELKTREKLRMERLLNNAHMIDVKKKDIEQENKFN